MSIRSIAEIEAALAGTGIRVRGAFAVMADDGVPALADGRQARMLVLLGNVGGSVWPAFERNFASAEQLAPDASANPLDDWVRSVVDPVARQFGALSVHPSDRPYAPFQRWAMRAEPVYPSPLGLLIHPVYGLWHAYRAALAFADLVELAAPAGAPSPCQSCRDRPCLSACPVSAFDGQRYVVDACAGHLRSGHEPACLEAGCRARDACPIGRDWRYPDAQVQFHMRAFLRARG